MTSSPTGGPPVRELVLEPEDLATLIRHAEAEAPRECCGILAGEPDGRVSRVFAMTNTRASAEEFLMDPAEQFAVLDAAREEGSTLLAVYHSHPSSPARPSEHDLAMAFYPDLAYLIVSLAGDPPTAKAFSIVAGKAVEIPVRTTVSRTPRARTRPGGP